MTTTGLVSSDGPHEAVAGLLVLAAAAVVPPRRRGHDLAPGLDLGSGLARGKPVDRDAGPSAPAAGPAADVEPAGRGPHNAGVYEHRGNGEHPQSLERRRQLLVWRSLAVLILFGGGLGLLRLVLALVAGAPAQSVVYQLGLLALNGLLGLLVLARLRSLRRR
jgi:hypothetical protein